MKILLQNIQQTNIFEYKGKKEIPCKDMDLDCLPDKDGHIPFGDYTKCYYYDPEQGVCPFVPFDE